MPKKRRSRVDNDVIGVIYLNRRHIGFAMWNFFFYRQKVIGPKFHLNNKNITENVLDSKNYMKHFNILVNVLVKT